MNAGIIDDSSKVWWHIRPSERYPTLEMRVTDLPTRMEDTIAVASMYVCVLRMLWRLKLENRRWRSYANFLVSENLWRAERYGTGGELIDFGKGELVPFEDLVKELVELVRPDAEAWTALPRWSTRSRSASEVPPRIASSRCITVRSKTVPPKTRRSKPSSTHS